MAKKPTIREQIAASPYGDYFARLVAMHADPAGVADRLAPWWASEGVYAYMQLKHTDGYKGDMGKIFDELKRQADEVTANV